MTAPAKRRRREVRLSGGETVVERAERISAAVQFAGLDEVLDNIEPWDDGSIAEAVRQCVREAWASGYVTAAEELDVIELPAAVEVGP